MIAQRKPVAHDRDLHPPCASREHGRDNVRRGHRAVGVLMMFVDAGAVEAQLLCVFELIEIRVVELMAFYRVLVSIGKGHPRRRLSGEVVEIFGNVGPRHQVEHEALHVGSPCASIWRDAICADVKPPPHRTAPSPFEPDYPRRQGSSSATDQVNPMRTTDARASLLSPRAPLCPRFLKLRDSPCNG